MPLSASEARIGFLPSCVDGRLLTEGPGRQAGRPSSTTSRCSRSQPGSDGRWLGPARSPRQPGQRRAEVANPQEVASLPRQQAWPRGAREPPRTRSSGGADRPRRLGLVDAHQQRRRARTSDVNTGPAPSDVDSVRANGEASLWPASSLGATRPNCLCSAGGGRPATKALRWLLVSQAEAAKAARKLVIDASSNFDNLGESKVLAVHGDELRSFVRARGGGGRRQCASALPAVREYRGQQTLVQDLPEAARTGSSSSTSL